jgi:hypothetical protein
MFLRRVISLLIACYAFAFAIGALAAVRWPSIMMAVGWMSEGDIPGGMAEVDWRQLGIAIGGPYLLAAVCFYASAVMVTARRHGAVIWFMLAVIAGFSCVFVVDFEPGWWRDPSAAEGAVAGAGVGAALLAMAVWDLRKRNPDSQKAASVTEAPVQIAEPAPILAPAPTPNAAIIKRGKPKPRLTSAAIMRQRESFVREGRKMQARRRR